MTAVPMSLQDLRRRIYVKAKAQRRIDDPRERKVTHLEPDRPGERLEHGGCRLRRALGLVQVLALQASPRAR
jgi:hypothetical protein